MSTLFKLCLSTAIVGAVCMLLGLVGLPQFNKTLAEFGLSVLLIGVGIAFVAFLVSQVLQSSAVQRKSAGRQAIQLQQMLDAGVLTQAEYDAKATELKKHFI